MLNPFRWKGHYFDEETGLYFANGRIYDPYLMQYLDADAPETLLSFIATPNSLDRNGITVDNSITYETNPATIFTSGNLFAQNPIDENADKTWWEVNWQKGLQQIGFVAAAIATIIVSIISPPLGLYMFISGLLGAISSVLISAAISGIISAITGGDVQKSISDEALYGALSGYTIGAIIGLAYAIKLNKMPQNPVGQAELAKTAKSRGAIPNSEMSTYLEKGKILDRYGSLGSPKGGGRFVTDVETPIDKLALPIKNSRTLTTLKVVKRIEVIEGVAANHIVWGTGGGVQYFLPKSVFELIEEGFLIIIK